MTQVGLESEARTDGDRIALWLWTAEEDPSWIHCQADCADASIKGHHVSRCEGTIPKVTPFEYEFPSPQLCRDFHKQVAMAIFAEIGGEKLIRSGEEQEDGEAGMLGAWREHLGAFGATPKPSSSVAAAGMTPRERSAVTQNPVSAVSNIAAKPPSSEFGVAPKPRKEGSVVSKKISSAELAAAPNLPSEESGILRKPSLAEFDATAKPSPKESSVPLKKPSAKIDIAPKPQLDGYAGESNSSRGKLYAPPKPPSSDIATAPKQSPEDFVKAPNSLSEEMDINAKRKSVEFNIDAKPHFEGLGTPPKPPSAEKAATAKPQPEDFAGAQNSVPEELEIDAKQLFEEFNISEKSPHEGLDSHSMPPFAEDAARALSPSEGFAETPMSPTEGLDSNPKKPSSSEIARVAKSPPEGLSEVPNSLPEELQIDAKRQIEVFNNTANSPTEELEIPSMPPSAENATGAQSPTDGFAVAPVSPAGAVDSLPKPSQEVVYAAKTPPEDHSEVPNSPTEGLADSPSPPHEEFLGDQRTVIYSRDIGIPAGLVKVGDRGALSMPHGRGFRIGARMSGFDAFAIAESKGLPDGLNPGVMGDPDIERAHAALAHVERPSSFAVAWYGVRDEAKSRTRMQAAEAMPILAGIVADRRTLASAVDRRLPLRRALSKSTGLGKASLRRIGKLRARASAGKLFEADERIEGVDALGVNRARHVRVSGAAPLDSALRHLAELPPDRTPEDDESWLKFNDILSATAIPLCNAMSVPVSEILGASRGDWIWFHGSLARAADFGPDEFDRRAMTLATVDALEAIAHFHRTVVLPLALAAIVETGEPIPDVAPELMEAGIEAAASVALGGSRNIAMQAMILSRGYVSRIPALMEIEGKSALAASEIAGSRFAGYGPTGFPLLTREFAASNGLMVRQLAHADAMSEESRRLRHCVGSYQSRARRTRCHIFSIQDASGRESYSTFELAAVEDDDARAAAARLRLVQHRARSNRIPATECAAARKEFLAAVKSGAVEINLAEIKDWRKWLRESGLDASNLRSTPAANWKSVLEHDWESEEIRLAFWREWSAMLGGRVVRWPHAGGIWTEKKGRDLINAMSPRAAAIIIERERRAGREWEG